MHNKRAEELIDKYLNRTCTPEESAMIESWYNETAERLDDLSEIHDYKRANQILSQNLSLRQKQVRLWPRIAVAAALFLIVGTGLYFYADRYSLFNSENITYAADINPGGNKAILTLANGETIALSGAKSGLVTGGAALAYNDGSKVTASDAVFKKSTQLLVRTPMGGTYQVVLPDGTKVWLNAASSLTFPTSFKDKSERIVKLSGEGYFEVAKVNAVLTASAKPGKKLPFIVMTQGQQVEVLGTHFNISNYADENSTRTTLLEGSVRINEEVVLKPGMQAVLDKGGKLKVEQLKTAEDVISWRNGYFSFDRESLEQIMRQVSRWYNVKIIYKNEAVKSIPFSGDITRFAKVSDLLKMLELTNKVRFRITSDTIIVDRK